MPNFSLLAAQTAQDGRYALRWFRREAVLTASIMLTLAFGVGLNAGVFSVLSGMVFRARVESQPASFFQILAPRLFASSVSDFAAYRTAPAVRSLAAWSVTSGRVDADADTTLLMLTSCGLFPLYGLDRPLAGRLFEGAECESPTASPVALISEQVWRSRFAASPSTLGSRLEIDRRAYSIVGIVPASFAGRLRGPGIWIPYTLARNFYAGADPLVRATMPWLTIEGRIASGFSREDAARQLRALTPGYNLVLTNGSIFQDPTSRTAAAATSILLTGALGLILLLACANVASLLLARAVSRRYEMSVRLSLGASPARLLRMSATEGVLLAALSGGISVAIAVALPATFQSLVPQMPHYPVHTDWPVFSYLAGTTLLAGLLASLVPAAESLRTNLSGSLKHEDSRTRRGLRLREVLVALQAGLSVILMIGAALFARAERRIVSVQSGFNANSVLIAPIIRGAAPLDRLQVPALVSSLFWARGEQTGVRAAGRTTDVQISQASPSLFEVLGLSFTHGHGLDATHPDGAVLTESAAATLFPGRDAIGQPIETAAGATLRVSGIVRASDLDARSPVPRLFVPIDPSIPRAIVLAPFHGDSEAAARALASALDSSGVTSREAPRTIAADLGALGSRFSVMAGFATFFGVSSFLLALIGLYGVIAFLVGRRTREMGIRLALGASRSDIVREVLRSGLKPVVWGLALALPFAGILAGGLGYAFRATPTPFRAADPLAFIAAIALVIAGGAAAILRPALRASAADPSASLRQD